MGLFFFSEKRMHEKLDSLKLLEGETIYCQIREQFRRFKPMILFNEFTLKLHDDYELVANDGGQQMWRLLK